MGLSVSQLQEVTKQSFNEVLRKTMASTELELTKCYDMLNAFITSVSCDFDFKGIENIKTNDAVGYIFSYKDYSDFRVIVLLYTECKNIQIRVVADKEEKGYIEKTSDEIVSTYGEFDNVIGIDVSEENGVYRNCKCGYTIEESKQGFLGSSDEVLFYIYFDENGIATDCEKSSRPGG